MGVLDTLEVFTLSSIGMAAPSPCSCCCMVMTQTVHDTNAGLWFLIHHFFSLDTGTKQCTIKHIKKFQTGKESA